MSQWKVARIVLWAVLRKVRYEIHSVITKGCSTRIISPEIDNYIVPHDPVVNPEPSTWTTKSFWPNKSNCVMQIEGYSSNCVPGDSTRICYHFRIQAVPLTSIPMEMDQQTLPDIASQAQFFQRAFQSDERWRNRHSTMAVYRTNLTNDSSPLQLQSWPDHCHLCHPWVSLRPLLIEFTEPICLFRVW